MGEIYCKCGLGCLRADYDRAIAAGADLAAQLGKGWKPRVWDSLGWRWSAKSGAQSVSPIFSYRYPLGLDKDAVEKYLAILVFNGKQFITQADQPNDAVGFAVQEARSYFLRAEQELAEFLETTL